MCIFCGLYIELYNNVSKYTLINIQFSPLHLPWFCAESTSYLLSESILTTELSWRDWSTPTKQQWSVQLIKYNSLKQQASRICFFLIMSYIHDKRDLQQSQGENYFSGERGSTRRSIFLKPCSRIANHIIKPSSESWFIKITVDTDTFSCPLFHT